MTPLPPLLAAGALLGLAAISPPASADGSITGKVTLDGPPTKLPPVAIAKDGAVCGKEAASEALVVGPGGGVANVVVALVDAPTTTAPATASATVDQVGCRYTPHVQAVAVGTKLQVLNNDAVFHNVHAQLVQGKEAATIFNVAMPFKGMKLPRTLTRPGVMKLRCDAGHTWMSAYVHVFPHRHFAVTDRDGAFTIRDVPAGAYTLEFWHEPIADKKAAWTQRTRVTVATGKAATANATYRP
jgi:plastocyanin